MKYFVKTRNWNCKMTIKRILDISLKFGAQRGDSYEDGDGKYCFESNSIVSSVAVWLFYMSVRHWSGGWTYIQNTSKNSNLSGYKSIYL